MSRCLSNLWLRAQGVPDFAIFERRWKNPGLFEVYPPHCVVCGRAWRPDKPAYVALYGRTRFGQQRFTEWYSSVLDIAATTGLAPDQDQIRHMCREHADRWPAAVDCVIGETVSLVQPLSNAQQVMRDVSYWGTSGLRLVYLLVQRAWLHVCYWFTKRPPVYIRGPWPPVRLWQKGSRWL